MSTAREDVLARIAAAYRTGPPAELDYASVERSYRGADDDRRLDHDQLRARLTDRLLAYKALVRLAGPDQLAQVIGEALAKLGVRRVVVPSDLDRSWLGGSDVEQWVDGPDSRLEVADLDGADGVVTGCALAIAETGTLILDAGPGQGRRALTLVPDYHLCVVHPDALCADVPQAVARLEISRPITMISGPSATSDIELDRVEGVHGPRTLEVIIVG